MNSRGFFRRVLIVILSVVSIHILGIELLLVFIVDPTAREFLLMLAVPSPLIAVLVGAYIVLTYLYCRPVKSFLDRVEAGQLPDRAAVMAAQDRAVNLAYFLAALSFPAYVTGGCGGVWLVRHWLNWPEITLTYGLLAGVIAGLLTTPMSLDATAWAVGPLLKLTLEPRFGMEPSRAAGFRLPLMAKFVILVVVMVVGITGWAVILGHSQTRAVIENQHRMEQLLSPRDRAALAREVKSSEDDRIRSSAYFESRMGSLSLFFAGFLVLGAALALVVGAAAARTTVRPIRTLKEVAEKAREGDYGEPVRLVSNDEFADLAEAMNRMTADLGSELERGKTLIEEISTAVRTLTPMSRDLVTVAQQQSSSSMEQAAAAEQAAATSLETTQVSRSIAANAGQVARAAEDLSEITQGGLARVELMRIEFDQLEQSIRGFAQASDQLGEQSRTIAGIVRLIGEIALQTDVLSLNANLEAVTAGAQGKRFTVIAHEVQALARRTTESAAVIEEIVSRMLAAVEGSARAAAEGTTSVERAREVIEEIVDMFGRILNSSEQASTQLKEIDIMTAQQASASEEMTRVVTEVKDTADQGSAAIDNLRQNLKEIDLLIARLEDHIKDGLRTRVEGSC